MQETRTPAARRSLVTGIVIGATIAAFVVTGTNVLSFVSSAKAQITTDRPANLLSFADIVDKVKPAVVSVRTKNEAPGEVSEEELGDMPPSVERFLRRFYGDKLPGPNRIPRNRRSQGQGSGFFISADGYVVTNNHVIDKATTVEVQTDDGKTYVAKVMGTDARTDLALLKVDGREDFPWVRLAPAAPRIGDWVLAVGNPFGLGGTVTAGIVSARGRDIGASTYDDFIQIDAAVNRGNSGGPTFNLAGEVIGVNTAIVSPTGGNVGIAFAIPAETVQTVVAALRAGKTVERGYLGVQISDLNQKTADELKLKSLEGVLVGEVQPGLPAAVAGIKSADVIVAIDGAPVKTARELQRKIASIRPDSTTKVKVLRDGKEQVIDVKLAKLPDQQLATTDPRMEKRKGPRGKDRGRSDNFDTKEQNLAQLGITVAPASEVQGAVGEGIIVTSVDPRGPGRERGLRTGDVILDIGGQKAKQTSDLNDAIAKARSEGKSEIMLVVRSRDGDRKVILPVGRS